VGLRLIVDSDGGVDDCTALWWLLQQPDVDLVAILATWGNADRDAAAGNLRRVLHAAGRDDVPVALGADDPIGPAPLPSRAVHVHGDDGLGGHGAGWATGDAGFHDASASTVLAELTAAEPGQLHLLTLGPLSTLASALAEEPAIATRVASLTVMGGAVTVPGNALPTAEANIGHDPEAAASVMGAAWPEPPLLVGLDVTLQARLDPDHLALAGEGRTSAAQMLAGPLTSYAAFYESTGLQPAGTFPCHDLLAAMAAVDPSILTEVATYRLAVDTGRSAAWGMTVADLRPAPQNEPEGFVRWRVGLGVDADRFRAGFRALMTEAAHRPVAP
jgi:inosine-uridine nucleoside N-ribohydrolase